MYYLRVHASGENPGRRIHASARRTPQSHARPNVIIACVGRYSYFSEQACSCFSEQPTAKPAGTHTPSPLFTKTNIPINSAALVPFGQDATGAAYSALGFSNGFQPRLPGDKKLNPYLRLLPMLAGIG